jgi:uncharacterized RDD family membrane protein YckC
MIYANLRDRFFALLLDFAIFCVVFFPTTRLVKGVWIMAASDHRWQIGWFVSDPLCMVFLGLIFVYFVALEGVFGQTIGKKIIGIKVVDKRQGSAGLRRAVLRNVLRLIDGLPAFSLLGVVLIVVTAERTRVGDIIAGTRVIKTRR